MYTQLSICGDVDGHDMGAQEPQPASLVRDGRQSNMKHMPSRALVKETQREINGGGTPDKSKKEGTHKAHDVAELEDYVHMLMPTFKKTPNSSLATGGLSWKRCLRLCLPGVEHGHRRNSGRETNQARRFTEERAKAFNSMAENPWDVTYVNMLIHLSLRLR